MFFAPVTGIVFGKCSFGLPVTGVKNGVPFLASKKPFLGVFCTDRCNFISGSLERPISIGLSKLDDLGCEFVPIHWWLLNQ